MTEINEAMIFAAGFGKRMLPLTKNTPKPLLKIQGKSIIIYLIEELLNNDFKNIVINCHYLPNKILDELQVYSPKVKFILEKEILDTGGGFLNALNKGFFCDTKTPKILINGDIIWKEKMHSPIDSILKNWHQEKMDLLLCLKHKANFLGYQGKGDFNLDSTGEKFSRINIKDEKKFVFTGLQIIKPEIIFEIKKKKFSMKEVFLKNIGKKLFGYCDKNDWFHISNTYDLKQVNEYFR
tara:strand:- start:533 stop:1246 length:714 start_codon:yes stop_codon:yes gene_type:complete